MQNVDFDGDGEISYSEFLTATLDTKTYLSKENLKVAFKHFDTE